ncbi:lipoprotein N-acyltransferase Lnb domain-containing protein [Ekhidna sp.]
MRFLLIGLLFFLCFTAKSQIQLSEEAEIAVVTLGPYQGEPWSAFGHNGFRVVDPTLGIDWFYDYGLYDFEQENFFLNFAKGLLKYRVGVREWERSFRLHKYLKRYIKLQYLNLNLEEKQKLFDFLQNNAKPENAEYLYHYVYDNCATKIRDVVEENFPRRIEFDLSYKVEEKTFRQLMDDYLGQQAWGDFGIDLGLGLQVDQEASAEEYMFLPPYVYRAFDGGTMKRNGEILPLVRESVDAYIPKEPSSLSVWMTPFNFFVILFFIAGLITHRNLKSGRRTKWIDALLFGFAGFVGLWVVYLWFGTEHMSKNNLNILWAIPFHLPLIFFIGRERFRNFFRTYFKVLAYWYCGLLLVWAILPQPLHQALVPFVLTLVLRSFYISYDLKK